ncbi:MAG: metalloregulator ArsR/SmtB family transcription factor [Pseudomonadota bacterium]
MKEPSLGVAPDDGFPGVLPPAFDDETLAHIAKALAHPARIALLRALKSAPSCCGHLVQDLARHDRALAQSTVSQHLNVLVEAGLVTRRSCGVESSYTMNVGALDSALQVFCELVEDGR